MPAIFSEMTMLHHASQSGHLDLCRFLIESNANVAARDIEYFSLCLDLQGFNSDADLQLQHSTASLRSKLSR